MEKVGNIPDELGDLANEISRQNIEVATRFLVAYSKMKKMVSQWKKG